MARFNLLTWLYKHSPVNFYSVTEKGETVIKSINNTFIGYKYSKCFEQYQIDKLRKDIKHFKRLFTVSVLCIFVVMVYGVVFPNYKFFSSNAMTPLLIALILLFAILIVAFCNSKIFELYLKRNFGIFEKTHFPSSDLIESQSYKDFKLELVKIFCLILLVMGAYICIGSPYETSQNLIANQRYSDAIKMTNIWSKIMPLESRWYSLRGYARYNLGDYEGAIEDYDKAYEIEDDAYRTMNFDNKIYIKYFIKDYEGAIKDFDTEIEKTSDDCDKDQLLWDKAQFLYHIGQYQKSLDIYNKLIINSNNDNVYLLKNRLYYERGQVYLALGKNREANRDFDIADELNLSESFQNPIPEPVLLFENIE